ncbi:MAG: histidine phosphatase family protein [Acidimicrobiia bacterium]
MEIYFARHAEAAWSVGGINIQDPELTELGRRQARLLARRLQAIGQWRELLISPAIRVEETAQPIAAAVGLRPLVIPDLVEIQMPDWTGTPAETVEQVFRDARHRPPEEWWKGLPGGETFRDFHDRVTSAMTKLLTERSVAPLPEGGPHLWEVAGDAGRILIIAHGGTNAVALGFLLGLDPTPWEWERFVSLHASLSRVQAMPLAGGHIFSLRSFSDAEHLTPEERTR